ncbi:hypothetical protein DPEC_G00242950 [Dallia pectoralis]|uniref:Uncharacterized protein n=1 Tax=Dallia pectoralis TaxID=75939 RepID=A0ACC2FVM0_DALPE|nr:hypothetical protein DPEC_G00242950 [Dallia pectoralis]
MSVQTLNQTFSFHLQMASFDIPTLVNYLVFIIGLLLYMFSVFCNLTIMLLIITQRTLHKPMFYILFSLPLNDLIGISSVLPRVLADILTQNHYVYYPTHELRGVRPTYKVFSVTIPLCFACHVEKISQLTTFTAWL